MKLLIYFITAISFLPQLQAQDNQERYWFYRKRLRDYFVKRDADSNVVYNEYDIFILDSALIDVEKHFRIEKLNQTELLLKIRYITPDSLYKQDYWYSYLKQ